MWIPFSRLSLSWGFTLINIIDNHTSMFSSMDQRPRLYYVMKKASDVGHSYFMSLLKHFEYVTGIRSVVNL